MIVARLCLEDDDTAFNEIPDESWKIFFAGIEELTKAQNKFQQGMSKITDELEKISKTLSESSINQLGNNNRPNNQNDSQQRRKNNNNNGNNNFNRINIGPRSFDPRGNHHQRCRHFQQISQNNQQNWRPETPISETITRISTAHNRFVVIAIFATILVLYPLIVGLVRRTAQFHLYPIKMFHLTINHNFRCCRINRWCHNRCKINNRWTRTENITWATHCPLSLSPLSPIMVVINKPRSFRFCIAITFSFPIKALVDTGAFSSAMP